MVCVPAASLVLANSANKVFAAAGRNEEVGLSCTVAIAVVIPWKLSENVTDPGGEMPPVGGVKFSRAAIATDCPARGCAGLKYKDVAVGVDLVIVMVAAVHDTAL